MKKIYGVYTVSDSEINTVIDNDSINWYEAREAAFAAWHNASIEMDADTTAYWGIFNAETGEISEELGTLRREDDQIHEYAPDGTRCWIG